MNTELQSLISLQGRYAEKVKSYTEALRKVEDLIDLEKKASGENGKPPLVVLHNVPRVYGGGDPEPIEDFSKLRKADASQKLFETFGDLRLEKLFEEMKLRKHPVSTPESLRSMLSGDERFSSRGKGIWGLSQPQLKV